jgi:hypothetical protein
MIVLLERILQTAAEIGGSCGALGIAAFAIVAVIAILGFVSHWGISDAPKFLRIIVGLAIVAGFLSFLANRTSSPRGQNEGSVRYGRIHATSYHHDSNDSGR